jgi:hypothetical protein
VEPTTKGKPPALGDVELNAGRKTGV